MNQTLETHFNRAKCILSASYDLKTTENIQMALQDLTIFIENVPQGQSKETDAMLAEAHNAKGNIYAGRNCWE